MDEETPEDMTEALDTEPQHAGLSEDVHHIQVNIPCLTGLPPSELDNIEQLGRSIYDGTLLLASVKQDGSFTDATFSCSSLLDRIYGRNGSTLGFDGLVPKTEMMRKDAHSFAKASHVHPEYDWLKVWPDFGKNGKNKDAEVSAVLATISFKNNGQQNDVDICLPVIELDADSPRPKHLVGELMFVAAKSFDELREQVGGSIDDPSAPDFSGWICPNGQTVFTRRFEFMEAKQCFGSQPTASSFTVPDLAGYFKPMADDSESHKILEKQDGKNAVPAHTHAGMADGESIQFPQTVKTAALGMTVGRSNPGGAKPSLASKWGVLCAWNKTTVDSQMSTNGFIVPYANQNAVYYREIDSENDQKLMKFDIDESYGIDGFKYVDENGNTIPGNKVNFTVEGAQIAEEGKDYDKHNEEETMTQPANVAVPVLVYIGFPDNSKYKYYG